MKVIIIGKSAEGKSTVAALLCRALNDRGIYCEIQDPEGDTHPLTVNSIDLAAKAKGLSERSARVMVEMQTEPLPTGRTPRPLVHPMLRVEKGKGVTLCTDDIDFTTAEINMLAGADELITKFKAAYPEVVNYMDIVKKHVFENKPIRDKPFGRKYRPASPKIGKRSKGKRGRK